MWADGERGVVKRIQNTRDSLALQESDLKPRIKQTGEFCFVLQNSDVKYRNRRQEFTFYCRNVIISHVLNRSSAVTVGFLSEVSR